MLNSVLCRLDWLSNYFLPYPRVGKPRTWILQTVFSYLIVVFREPSLFSSQPDSWLSAEYWKTKVFIVIAVKIYPQNKLQYDIHLTKASLMPKSNKSDSAQHWIWDLTTHYLHQKDSQAVCLNNKNWIWIWTHVFKALLKLFCLWSSHISQGSPRNQAITFLTHLWNNAYHIYSAIRQGFPLSKMTANN